ncbi:hypothetical protein [Cupriavidus sp. DL-D2]|uniref:hypothetical protein n=1 Tax=Cupriavidus sp. DL-D2 TaxID=3144974 RepID=UPI0032147D74
MDNNPIRVHLYCPRCPARAMLVYRDKEHFQNRRKKDDYFRDDPEKIDGDHRSQYPSGESTFGKAGYTCVCGHGPAWG